MAPQDGQIAWLLEGDPAIRWQVLRDLLDADPAEVEEERARVAGTGWGARLLAEQDADGRWGGGLYSPKWVSTTYTLWLLHWLGLPPAHPAALAGCAQLWASTTNHDGGLNIGRRTRSPETCITGIMVLLSSSFRCDDPRVDPTVTWLLSQQLHDGGWNCAAVDEPTKHGSFHTSVIALEALDEYARARGRVPVADALERGREFFLTHRVYQSHRTGATAIRDSTRFPFPPQWHFDVLRGLELFSLTGQAPDQRMRPAVEIVRNARRKDGTWPTFRGYPGKEWFTMEERGPSRWNTLRAQRLLRWWDRVIAAR